VARAAEAIEASHLLMERSRARIDSAQALIDGMVANFAERIYP